MTIVRKEDNLIEFQNCTLFATVLPTQNEKLLSKDLIKAANLYQKSKTVTFQNIAAGNFFIFHQKRGSSCIQNYMKFQGLIPDQASHYLH